MFILFPPKDCLIVQPAEEICKKGRWPEAAVNVDEEVCTYEKENLSTDIKDFALFIQERPVQANSP